MKLLVRSLTLGICWLLAASLYAGEGQVKLEKKGDKVEVTIDGQPFTTYHTSDEFPKPFFHPVRSAGGTIITRELENPKDHPHHKGIWCAIDEVNGIKFWAEKGTIRNAKVEVVEAQGNPARLVAVNHWLGEDGKPILEETTKVAIYGNRLLAFDITFKAVADEVVFEDTKEGLFGIRVANTMRESEGGRVFNQDGVEGTKENWGKHHNWIDYIGEVNDQTHGAALFDHPENPRRSRYHVRNYGLFTLSPFGESAYTNGKNEAQPLHLKAGETFRLRYALYIHPGDTKAAKVGQVYDQWVKSAK